MKHVRQFNPAAVTPGKSQTLVDLSEGLGCSISLHRGGSDHVESAVKEERLALILEGEGILVQAGTSKSAAAGEMIFIPAGGIGAFMGNSDTTWIEIHAPLPDDAVFATRDADVIQIDHSKFEGGGFAYQSMIDRNSGSGTMRINVLQVQPGSGSPDYHIHAFAQIYVIQEGEMTIDIGRKRVVAPANSVVILPEGLVHRNFNASTGIERHISLLVPEPKEGAVFDYAVSIHEEEAELLTSIPN
jgi:mannose-6-phosphate isomerase-like protein (cupin superfamily)